MRLIEIDGRYEAESSYDERTIPKGAGFKWDPASKVWYTHFPDVAANLIQYADASLKARILEAAEEREREKQVVKLTLRRDRFECICHFDNRHIPKDAGFRWDGDNKAWYTEDAGIASGLLKYADDLALAAIKGTIQQEARAVEQSHLTEAEVDIPHPPGLEYRPFQKAGIDYAIGHPNCLIADEPGCISGDAMISVHRAGRSFKIRMDTLFHRFNGGGRWDPDIQTMARSLMPNGTFRLNEVLEVIHKGVMEVLLIKTESGKELKLTPDHEVLTDSGWKRADQLSLGETVLTNGKMVCKLCGSDKHVIRYQYAKFRGYCKECMYRQLRENHLEYARSIKRDGEIFIEGGMMYHPNTTTHGISEHRLVVEADMNGFSLDEWLAKIRMNDLDGCVFLGTDLEVHHINGDPADNRIENLQVVTTSDHRKIDDRYKNISDVFIPKDDKIINITPAGKDDVFDIVMSDPGRNFIANGIVVHNCGKTIQALGVVNYDPLADNVLVVCPASLKLNWEREAKRWLVRDIPVAVINGTKAKFPEGGFVILNYELLSKYRSVIDRISWDVLIFDESHFLKNDRAARTVAALGKWNRNPDRTIKPIKAKRRLFLTGTPILNKPIELWTTIHSLDPKTWGSWKDYTAKYCDAHETRWGWDVNGASNLPELQDKLRARIMVRRLKSEVMTELPPKQRQVIVLPSKSSVMKREKKFAETLEAMLAGADIPPVEFESMSKVRHETAVDKIPDAIDHIKALMEEHQKLVVMCHHRDVLEAIALGVQEFGVVRLQGGDSEASKQDAIDRFQNDPEVRIFLGSIRAAGVGITLTAASLLLFVELDWVPGIMTQAEDRIHRIGTAGSVLIQHLVFADSIDARMAEAIVEKQGIIEQALD